MLRWYPDALLRIVLLITFGPILFMSTLAVNCLCDPTTPWRVGPLQGPGATGDFWVSALVLAFGWTLITLGWRGAGPAFRTMLLMWHAALCATYVTTFAASDDVVVHGESIGLRVSMRLLGPTLIAAGLICSIIWVAVDIRHGTEARTVSPLQPRNKIAGALAVGLLVLGGLAFSRDHEQVGVVVSALGFIAGHELIRPLNPSEELRKAMLFDGSAPR